MPRITSKPIKNAKRNSKKMNSSTAKNPVNLPKTSTQTDRRPQYNPTWNPQYLKVARRFQYSAPAADFGGGFGKIQDPAVGPSATLLSYNAGVMTFALTDVPNIAEYTTLFDQYRLAAIALEIIYVTSSETVNTVTTGINQQVTAMIYEDNDDATAPASTNAGWQSVLQSGRAKQRVFPGKNNVMKYTLYPKILTAELDTAAGTAARGLASPWLDPATTDAKFFGVKWILQCNPAPVTMNHAFRVNATYFMEWRSRQ